TDAWRNSLDHYQEFVIIVALDLKIEDLKPTLLKPCVQFLGHILVTRTAEQCEHVLLVVICLNTDSIGFKIAGVKAKIALYQFLRFHNFGFTSPQLHHEFLIFIAFHK
ncbi:hypothetical protein OIU47_11105, partial [Lacticaseibacillus paracasei]